MTSTAITPTTSAVTTKQKVGLGLCIVYGVTNIPSVLMPTPDGDAGPPFGILVVCTVLGLVATVAAAVAWRGSRLALRVAAGAAIVITLTALPALFVDDVLGALSVLITVVMVVLMFSAERRSATVVD
jgi:hypothetical protein